MSQIQQNRPQARRLFYFWLAGVGLGPSGVDIGVGAGELIGVGDGVSRRELAAVADGEALVSAELRFILR
ncbi:MAG TPA: hypothetical protein VGH07_03225 [Chthoniobacterales bacterium]|jgi:hypothetical protein